MTAPRSGPRSFSPLAPEQLDALRRLDTCSLANAIEVTGTRLRNDGYMDSSIACLFPDMPPLVGYALPVRVKTSDPPIEGRGYVDRADWWDRLLALPEPRILAVEDVQSHAGTGSCLGEVHANIYSALGCAGFITNGAVRDLPAVRRLGFQVFAGHVSVSHAYAHVVEVGSPVVIGGLEVHTGDLLHADLHGVLSIPLEVAADLSSIVAAQKMQEQTIIGFCRSPGFTAKGLEQLLEQVQGPRQD